MIAFGIVAFILAAIGIAAYQFSAKHEPEPTRLSVHSLAWAGRVARAERERG